MNKLKSTFHRLCEPAPGTFPDELTKELRARRNKRFLTTQCLMLILLTTKTLLINREVSISDCWFISVFIIDITVFCLFARSYPHFFKLFYAVMITLSGPGALYFDPRNGIFGCLTIAVLAPMILLYFTDCCRIYIVQIAIQLVLMHQYYRFKIVEAINLRTTEDFVTSLVRSQMFAITISSFIMYCVGVNLLRSLRQDIVSKDRERTELEVQKTFVLSFSHEIRNLINNLTGNIQLSLLEDLASKVKGYLEDAEVGAGLLLQLINNVLDTGNLAVGELDINHSNQRIHNTLEKVWRICAYALKTKSLKGKLQIMKSIPKNLKLDHERFMQILVNLIINAVKFTEKGTIDIKIEWIPDTVNVTESCFSPSPFDDEDEGIFEKDQAFSLLGDDFTVVGIDTRKWSSNMYTSVHESGHGLLKITVTDTGYGVTRENISRVFDRFSSQIFGDESMSKKLGTTIGLYVTKELCNIMGGDIRVFSKIDKGTSFIACIPAEQALPEKIQHTGSTIFSLGALPEEKKLRAMIVDDMQFNITVLTNYLERMRLKVANTAMNGLDAFNKYVESVQMGHKFDVVTMDVEMPVMDGKEAAKKIREFEKENDCEPCLIIMISGNVCESEICKCLKYNGEVLANYFLKKPAIFDDVFRLIREHFSMDTQTSISTDNQDLDM